MGKKFYLLQKRKSFVSLISLVCTILVSLFAVYTVCGDANDERSYIEGIKIYDNECEAIEDLIELYKQYLQDRED